MPEHHTVVAPCVHEEQPLLYVHHCQACFAVRWGHVSHKHCNNTQSIIGLLLALGVAGQATLPNVAQLVQGSLAMYAVDKTTQ